MKARVEILIRDEEGNRLSQLDPYQMDLGSQSLHDIEGAVEHWRQQALPDIEAELLRQAQSQFTQQGKNREPICNGTRPVCIKTLHGQVPLSVADLSVPRTRDKLLAGDTPVERRLCQPSIAGVVWLLQQSP